MYKNKYFEDIPENPKNLVNKNIENWNTLPNSIIFPRTQIQFPIKKWTKKQLAIRMFQLFPKLTENFQNMNSNYDEKHLFKNHGGKRKNLKKNIKTTQKRQEKTKKLRKRKKSNKSKIKKSRKIKSKRVMKKVKE